MSYNPLQHQKWKQLPQYTEIKQKSILKKTNKVQDTIQTRPTKKQLRSKITTTTTQPKSTKLKSKNYLDMSFEQTDHNLIPEPFPIKHSHIVQFHNDIDKRLTYTLSTLGIDFLLEEFQTNMITFNDLLLLSKDDLEELKLPFGPKNRLLKFASMYKQFASEYTLNELISFFNQHQSFIISANQIHEQDIRKPIISSQHNSSLLPTKSYSTVNNSGKDSFLKKDSEKLSIDCDNVSEIKKEECFDNENLIIDELCISGQPHQNHQQFISSASSLNRNEHLMKELQNYLPSSTPITNNDVPELSGIDNEEYPSVPIAPTVVKANHYQHQQHHHTRTKSGNVNMKYKQQQQQQHVVVANNNRTEMKKSKTTKHLNKSPSINQLTNSYNSILKQISPKLDLEQFYNKLTFANCKNERSVISPSKYTFSRNKSAFTKKHKKKVNVTAVPNKKEKIYLYYQNLSEEISNYQKEYNSMKMRSDARNIRINNLLSKAEKRNKHFISNNNNNNNNNNNHLKEDTFFYSNSYNEQNFDMKDIESLNEILSDNI